MVVPILSVLLPYAGIAVKHVYETYVKQRKESGDWNSEGDGKVAFKKAVEFVKELIDEAVEKKEIKKGDTPSESEIEAAVQSKVGEVTTRIRAATPQEMISSVETALKKVKKEYIAPYKNKDTEGYDDAEKKEAYRRCMAQVKVLMKYHNFKVNQEIIDLYILTMDTEDEVMKTLEYENESV
uniref:Uncharacterized protein n=1 Tax=Candidatus Methanophaga sp. ANME-1 ERB7 TaxID=2759913 RepID=A0A7G9Z4N4_9EURY|nr:hypothetical protein MHJDHPNH_00020 [Methanosarcinales archaeon ANME-1 ERB7]